MQIGTSLSYENIAEKTSLFTWLPAATMGSVSMNNNDFYTSFIRARVEKVIGFHIAKFDNAI